MRDFDESVVSRRFYFRRGYTSLDPATERREMRLEDSLSLVLGKAALKRTSAIGALKGERAKFRPVRAIQSGPPDVLGGIEERREQADGFQDFKRAGFDRRGPRLAMRAHFSLDEPHTNAVAGKLTSSEQSGGAGADN
jgi:hypothetical protein